MRKCFFQTLEGGLLCSLWLLVVLFLGYGVSASSTPVATGLKVSPATSRNVFAVEGTVFGTITADSIVFLGVVPANGVSSSQINPKENLLVGAAHSAIAVTLKGSTARVNKAVLPKICRKRFCDQSITVP